MRYFEFYGGAADKIHGDTIPFLDGYTALTLREPHGVVAGIIPWNYPLQILGALVGAALAMGNALVVKPAEDASLTTIRIAELALEAGFPDGRAQRRHRLGREAGAALSAHPGVDHVTFTGSPATGTAIQQAAARQQSRRHDGARRQVAADRLRRCRPRGGAAGAGQRHHPERRPDLLGRQPRPGRAAGLRRAWRAGLAERFSSARRRAARCRPRPRPADQRAGRRSASRAWSPRPKRPALPVLARGSVAADAPAGGYYFAPALFGAVDPRCDDRAGGGVRPGAGAVCRSTTRRRRSALANGTDYGLVAGVWTRDGARQHRVAKRVRAGQVFVNGYGAGGGVELPFGGFKQLRPRPREGLRGALRHVARLKTIVFNHG